jgi:hypothetical protein
MNKNIILCKKYQNFPFLIVISFFKIHFKKNITSFFLPKTDSTAETSEPLGIFDFYFSHI